MRVIIIRSKIEHLPRRISYSHLRKDGIVMIYAAILAGGKGIRMGGDLPKQYLTINGVPILVRTVRAFLRCGIVDGIVLCVPGDYMEYTSEVLNKYPDTRGKVNVIEGGSDRTGSMENAIRFFERSVEISGEDILITHDCVRPFVTDEMIFSSVNSAMLSGGATAAIPCVDTICISSDGKEIESVPDRSMLYSVQTPQTFLFRDFREILFSLTQEERRQVTDASAVFRLRGRKVVLSEGSPSNIKITHPSDIPLAEKLAERFDS